MKTSSKRPYPAGSTAFLAVTLAVMFSGCATTYISTDKTQNPPPKEAFSAFSRYELFPIEMGPPYKGQEANEKALMKIQENFSLRVEPLVENWNLRFSAGGSGRTLLIKPRIKDIKFVNATARVWAGAMAGSSAVVIAVDFIDAATDEIIAQPEFYQRAAAMGGAWSFGATDNNMLVRITEIAADYFKANYDEAVGGPTGAPEPKK